MVLIGLVNHRHYPHLTVHCHRKGSLVVELVRWQLNLAGQVGPGLLPHQPAPNEGQEETKSFQTTYVPLSSLWYEWWQLGMQKWVNWLP